MDETEKRCSTCGEYWPETQEFFRFRFGRFDQQCKACADEKTRRTNRVKLCCYPGCANPRYADHYTRCYEHRYYAIKVKAMNEQVYQNLGRKTW